MKKRDFRVLIVDDNQAERETLRDILEEKGYKTDTAQDGLQAYRAMQKRRYNLVFMDIRMPNLNGFLSSTFIGLKHPETEVIMITGYSEDVKVKRILEVIPRGRWLKKPLSPDEILRIAEDVKRAWTLKRNKK
jgi:two-component system response regulator HydG